MNLRFGLIGSGGGGHLFAGALARRPGDARLVDGWEGRRTTALMEAFYESARTGQVINAA